MDRLLREGNPPTGQMASPKPQYKKPGVDEYEPVEGQHGAPFAILKDANGAVVSPATEATLEQVKSELELVKNELQTIKANQLSGDQKVQQSGNIVEVVTLAQGFEITAGSKVFVPTNIRRSYLDTASMAISIEKTNTTVGIHNHPIKVWFYLNDIAHPRVELYNGTLNNYRRIIPRFEMPFPAGVFEIENGDTETTKLTVLLYKYRI